MTMTYDAGETGGAAAHRVTDAAAENLLCDLVAIPSPSGDELAASQALVNWMRRHGAREAYVDHVGSAVAVFGRGDRDLLLLGHIDTFGGNPPVRREGRRLYGRGTVDAKGALCAFAAAAARARIPDGVRVVVVGAVQEEAPTSAGARHLLRDGYQPAACIIGEPSQWDRITLGYKGRLVIHAGFRGGLTHSSTSDQTTAERAVAYWLALRAWVDGFNLDGGRRGLFDTLTASLLALNTRSDGIHERADLSVSLRLPPGLDPDALTASLAALPGDFGPLDAFDAIGGESAYRAERDSALSRGLRGAIRAHGGTPRFVYKTGTADMNVVGHVWDCPMVAYGPGDSALDHTPDEHIDLDDYLRAIAVLTRLIESADGLLASGSRYAL
jgi:LysW-gamma-L-lysine carboxypeptidase